MLGIIASAVLATQAMESRPTGAGVPKSIACAGSLLPNTSTNGKDDHGDQISARRTIWSNDRGKQSLLGYEYQTYGGREFIQFVTTFSSSLFPFHGSVYDALQNALTITRTSRDTLPAPLRQLEPNTPIVRGTCK